MTIGRGIETFRQADAVIGDLDNGQSIRGCAATDADFSRNTGRMGVSNGIYHQFGNDEANRSRHWSRHCTAGLEREPQFHLTGKR